MAPEVHALHDERVRALYVGPARLDLAHVMHADLPRAYGVAEDRRLRLLHLYVPPPLRGRGIATLLLHRFAAEARSCGARRLEVDDMSDGFRTAANVYVHAGFRYVGASGPEMEASPRHVLLCTARRLRGLQVGRGTEQQEGTPRPLRRTRLP